MSNALKYPSAIDSSKVGTYEPIVFSGGGHFYDNVLEYRVWVKNHDETAHYCFATYEEAATFSKATKNAEKPVVLVLQKEYIDEQDPDNPKQIKKERMAEWLPEWLPGNMGTHQKIPEFFKRRKH